MNEGIFCKFLIIIESRRSSKFLPKNYTSQPKLKKKSKYVYISAREHSRDRLNVCVLALRSKQNALVEDEGPIRIPSSVYRRDTANDHQPQD